MFLNLINKIIRSYTSNYEYAIAILASIMVFRKPGTTLILLFIAFNFIFYKRLEFNAKKILPISTIAIPFILDLFFLWNNIEILEGYKHLEKRIVFIVFPLLIINQSFSLNVKKILKIYSVIFSTLLFILFIKFILTEHELVQKYLKGSHVWQMGYSFANSTSVHAPALNLHVAFLVVVNTYLLVNHLINHKCYNFNYRLFLFIGSVLMLLIINTRLAILSAFGGIFMVLFMEFFNKKISKRKIISIMAGTVVIFLIVLLGFIKVFPYMIKKYTNVTFAHMDKIGQLDEFENPEGEVFNSLVTRLSIWKTAWDRAQEDLLIGVGAADGKYELNRAYVDTNQNFLAKYEFPTHNQYLDFLLKFGILGLLGLLIFIFNSFWIGWKLKSSIVLFFSLLCFASNLTDDFFIRYDGITFFALWSSIFANVYWNNPLNRCQSRI